MNGVDGREYEGRKGRRGASIGRGAKQRGAREGRKWESIVVG